MQDEESYENLVWFQDLFRADKAENCEDFQPTVEVPVLEVPTSRVRLKELPIQRDFGAYTVDFTVSGESRALDQDSEHSHGQTLETSESKWIWDILAPPEAVPENEISNSFGRLQQLRSQMHSTVRAGV